MKIDRVVHRSYGAYEVEFADGIVVTVHRGRESGRWYAMRPTTGDRFDDHMMFDKNGSRRRRYQHAALVAVLRKTPYVGRVSLKKDREGAFYATLGRDVEGIGHHGYGPPRSETPRERARRLAERRRRYRAQTQYQGEQGPGYDQRRPRRRRSRRRR